MKIRISGTDSRLYRLPFCLLLGAVMFGFIWLAAPYTAVEPADKPLIAVLFSVLYAAFTAVFCFDRDADDISLLFLAAALAALVYMRVSLLYFKSNDYNNFLSVWLAEMRTYDGAEALRVKIGDYNMPYLYFLFIVSKLGLNDLVLIKWFSCIFDCAAAYFVMKCVGLKTDRTVVKYGALILTLAAPTVLMNSAYWGQCDSIIAAFCAAALYYALCGRGTASVVMYAVAFSFKLQAIFPMPAMLVCLLAGRIRLRHTALFPAVFLAALLPAMLAGRSFYDCISIYFHQAGQYENLTLNAPSFYQMLHGVAFSPFNSLAVMLAGLAALMLVFLCFRFKEHIGNRQLVCIFFLSALLLPYFLPRMHERYFFLADVLSLVFFFYNPKKWYIPFAVILASFNACVCFLTGGEFYIIEQKHASLLLLAVICVTLSGLLRDFAAAKKCNTD